MAPCCSAAAASSGSFGEDGPVMPRSENVLATATHAWHPSRIWLNEETLWAGTWCASLVAHVCYHSCRRLRALHTLCVGWLACDRPVPVQDRSFTLAGVWKNLCATFVTTLDLTLYIFYPNIHSNARCRIRWLTGIPAGRCVRE